MKGIAALLPVLLIAGAAAFAQEGPVTVVEPDEADLDWMPWISDVPTTDLSGTWVFDRDRSDPMPAAWRDRPVVYEIFQQLDRIVLRFRTGGETIVQNLTWTGAITDRNQEGLEIRERSRWTDSGRTFEIEGRWWLPGDKPDPRAFLYRFALADRDTLLVTQEDEFGTTTWRFRRED